jgi:1-acyl-sn-glycerol-3-phosphate acyltransferase
MSSTAIGAIAFSLLAAFLLAWLFVRKARGPLNTLQYFLYLFNYALTRILWRAEINSPLDLSRGPGAVIVCNHCSSVDTCFIQLAAGKRVVHWMVAKEYFAQPGFGQILRLVECIPVSRGGIDTAATKLSIRLAQKGDLVGLFPEGKINTTDKLLLPGRPGAAMIALKARVPVIPCYLEGVPYGGTVLSSLFMPAKVRLKVGKPIDLSPYYDRQKEPGVLQDITKLLLQEMAALAGQPNFEPELAGKKWKADADEVPAIADPA